MNYITPFVKHLPEVGQSILTEARLIDEKIDQLGNLHREIMLAKKAFIESLQNDWTLNEIAAAKKAADKGRSLHELEQHYPHA